MNVPPEDLVSVYDYLELQSEDLVSDSRVFLEEKVFPVLIPGLAELLRSKTEVGFPDFNPLCFLASYLMRHNPNEGIFKDRKASKAEEDYLKKMDKHVNYAKNKKS